MMKTLLLIRDETSDEGTFGVLTFGDHKFQSLELPQRDNKPQISCVNPGLYTCTWDLSQRHGWCYHVQGVFHRDGIEIHSANWAGDKSKNLKCELLGCIALGMERGVLEGQKAILQSKDAIMKFNEAMNREAFQLTIH